MSASGPTMPSAAPVAVAARLRRPSWRDPKLLVGLLIVLASVAVVARLVAAADETVPVYVSRATLPTGTPLTSDVLAVARVRLTGTTAAYLDARSELPSDQVLLRQVGPGELVPMTAVGSAADLLARPVSIPLEGAPPAALTTGGQVDVWSSARKRDTASGAAYAAPRRLARSVEVYDVARGGDGLSATRTSTVEVLLDETELPLVLDALANEARIALVPVPGSSAARDAP